MVDKKGNLTANNATLRGVIEATGGTISNFGIKNGHLLGGDETNGSILLKTGDITPLSALKGSGAPINETNLQGTSQGWEVVSNGAYEVSVTPWIARQITLSETSLVEIGEVIVSNLRVTGGAGRVSGTTGRVQIAYGNGSTQFVDEMTRKIMLPEGSYEVRVVPQISTATTITGGSGDTGEGNGYGSMSWACDVRLTLLKVHKNSKEVSVGRDGICVFSNENAYFYCSKDYGFEMKFGNFGLKCSASGLYKWDDQWVRL